MNGDMTKYIIGTISNMDAPMTPATKGERSMNLYMNHVSQRDDPSREKSEVLDATQDQTSVRLPQYCGGSVEGRQICA